MDDRRLRLLALLAALLAVLWIGPSGAAAQNSGDLGCPSIVETALDMTDLSCGQTGRDEVCYGHLALEATLRGDPDEFVFERSGDVVPLPALDSLRLSAMDIASEVWGVALLRLQANLPGTLPGQNVTMLVFGDVNLTYAGESPGAGAGRPVQAFYFTSGLSDSPCVEAPNSGMLLRSPEVAEAASLQINGVDMLLSSTVFVEAESGGGLVINLLEGEVQITAFGVTQVLHAGERVVVPLNDAGSAAGPPEPPEAIHEPDVQALPLWLLDRTVKVYQCTEGGTVVTPAGDRYIVLPSDGPQFASSLNAFSFGAEIDGQSLPAISRPYLWRIGEYFHVQQRFDGGAREMGTHTVTFLGAVSRAVTDPFTAEPWGPGEWSNTCTWIIEGE